MRQSRNNSGSFLHRASVALDDVVGVISPRRAMLRRAHRFSYDALDQHRTRKKRSITEGTGDLHLTDANLDKLRMICRDLGRNNPLIKGMFRKLATNIIGTATKIQARTEDEGWNKAAEELWKEEMINKPCDVTGRFNLHAFLKKMYFTYLRDGDMFVLFVDNDDIEGIQAIEGDQVGTPYDRDTDKNFDVVSGVALSKKYQRVGGYYIGTPNKWGYIKNEDIKQYDADEVHHIFSSDRFSCTRGEPALISAVDMIDKLFDYIDAELVAAKISACFPMMVTTFDPSSKPRPYTKGVSPSGKDEQGRQLEKIEAGTMMYGEPGEDVKAIGATRPASAFDSFILKIMMLIGSPVNMPLMLATGDFSGATYMNTRVAYQEARHIWRDEQALIIKPFVRRLWLLRLEQWIKRKVLTECKDWARHEILCKRWPYVDPWKESKADEQQLKNGTTTRTAICGRQGDDFKDITDQRAEEDEYLKEKGVVLVPPKMEKPAA